MWGNKSQAEPKLVCSLVKSPEVFIEAEARQKIEALMGAYSHQEWIAYLKGRISELGNIFVETISVPPHKYAHGASAEAEPFHVPEDCVGIIHSHHTMGAFHSGTDQDYVDKNFPVSITVARGTNKSGGSPLSFDAVSYAETPCGKYMESQSVVRYVQPPPTFDTDKWLKSAKANVDKGKGVGMVLGKYMGGYPYTYNYAHNKEQDSYVPIRYRKDELDVPCVITPGGNVLTEREYNDMINNSEEGEIL